MILKPRYRKILLINPWHGDVFPPPSIGYLHGAIKAHFRDEIDVKALDLPEAITTLQSSNFDLVGVSFHSMSVKYAEYIRQHVKKGKLICGGHHTSALPEQMLKIGYDQVVIGEGENALIDIILGKGGEIVVETNKYFESIDDIPLPNYTGLKRDESWGLPIISSRGCIFKCNFCASQHFWNRKWKMRDSISIINEIRTRIEEGMKTWMFEDDNFTLNKKRAIDICRKIKEEIHPAFGEFGWQCASRAESLNDDELCKALKEAGCFTVWLGVETLSQKALDRCKKKTTVEKIVSGINNARKHGLDTMCQFIIGLPGDTEKDMIETRKNVEKYNISRIATNYAWILPQTEIWKQAKLRGFKDYSYIKGKDLTYTYEQPMEVLERWNGIVKFGILN